MDICLEVFIPNGVVNDINFASILPIQVRRSFAVPNLIVLIVFFNCFITSAILLAICSILLLAFGSIVSIAIVLLFSSFFSKEI